MAIGSSTTILGFSVKFLFQTIYNDYAYFERDKHTFKSSELKWYLVDPLLKFSVKMFKMEVTEI